jgi:hypothetical protein
MKIEHKISIVTPEGRRPFERLMFRKDNNTLVLKEQSVRLMIGFIWLRIRTSGELV